MGTVTRASIGSVKQRSAVKLCVSRHTATWFIRCDTANRPARCCEYATSTRIGPERWRQSNPRHVRSELEKSSVVGKKIRRNLLIQYIAQYKAPDGATYSCPVVLSGQKWMLQTAHGLRDITFYIPEETSPSGLIEFHDYKISAAAGMRSADVFAADTEMRRTLPYPVKPAVTPERARVSASVRNADNWTPPKPIVVPGSKSTALDERWQPRFHKMNRVQKGCLFAEKCLGVDYDSKEKYYRCRCVACGKSVQASQSDLLLERVKYCAKHG